MFHLDKNRKHITPEYRTGLELKRLIDDLKGNLRVVVDHDGKEKYRRTYSKILTDLKECACNSRFRTFDRSDNNRRSEAEVLIINTVKRRFTAHSHSQLTYLSLGSGFLLQDFFICASLILLGYCLKIRIIESKSQGENAEAFRAAYTQFIILKHFAEQMGLQFESEYFQNMMEYLNKFPYEQIHVGIAIDFEEFHKESQAIVDALLVHYSLHRDGFLYLAYRNYNFQFNANEVKFFNSIPGVVHTFYESVLEQKEIIKKETKMNSKLIIKNILLYANLFEPQKIYSQSNLNNPIASLKIR